MNYISNAFSLNMIVNNLISKVRFEEIRDPSRLDLSNHKSIVGHVDIAAVLSEQLGRKVEFNRTSLKIDDPNTTVLIGQYKGPRLEEGATSLPEGAIVEYVLMYFAD